MNYSVDHHNNYFYFLTNKNGKNNWILRSKSCGAREVRKDCSQNQEVVIPHRDFVLVEGTYNLIKIYNSMKII